MGIFQQRGSGRVQCNMRAVEARYCDTRTEVPTAAQWQPVVLRNGTAARDEREVPLVDRAGQWSIDRPHCCEENCG
jgi:hypothetical protein